MNKDNQWSKQRECFSRATQVWLAVIRNTSVTLVDEFDVRSVLNGQVRLAAVIQMHVFHEAMNGYKNLKIH